MRPSPALTDLGGLARGPQAVGEAGILVERRSSGRSAASSSASARQAARLPSEKWTGPARLPRPARPAVSARRPRPHRLVRCRRSHRRPARRSGSSATHRLAELEHVLIVERHRVGVVKPAARRRRLVDRLPVDDAVDEVDRVAVRREGHQDAAIADGLAALVLELGLEADRRAVGDDLHVMVGQARQQRAARHVGDRRACRRRARIRRGSRRRCRASPGLSRPQVKSSSTLCAAKSSTSPGSRSSIDGKSRPSSSDTQ